MQSRGVTRPMALQEAEGGHDGHMEPGETLAAHHRHVVWIPWTLILLGVWLAMSPATLGYGNEDLWAVPSGGRGAWLSPPGTTHDSLRAALMTWSDVVSGALLAAFGWRALRPDRPRAWWGACAVGTWLLFAPVVLWSPTAAGFLNASLVGLLVIALTILVPGMPNMAKFMEMGPPTPPGWSYNPSSWPQRSVLIALGFAGLVVSRYLAVYQLGYVDEVWDPFFGFDGGTRLVLDSEMSQTWPISDAGLGAVAYSFEFLMGFMGGRARWRTMPWMVSLFGILVVPLGLAHITLVMSQPIVVHEWCTLCLLAAAVMLPMITLTVDEVVAMGQHVVAGARRGDRGGSSWKVFWLGGSAEGCTPDERTPPMAETPDRPGAVLSASAWGASVPWNLAAATALGVWLLAAPAAFGIDIRDGAADLAHAGGALVVVVGVVAFGEVVRSLRWVNVGAGIAIAVAVLLLDAPAGYTAATALAGLAVAALSAPRGPVRERYGRWDRPTR